MTRALFVLLACLPAISCAAKMDPLLEEASRIPSFEARYEAPQSAEMAKPLEALIARLASWGVSVAVVKSADLWVPGAFGVMDPVTRAIQLDERMSIDSRFEVLAHEAGHLFQPPSVSKAEAEVFADLVARDVCAYHKRDVQTRFAGYLARFKNAFGSEPAMRHDIRAAARYVTGQAEPPASWREQR